MFGGLRSRCRCATFFSTILYPTFRLPVNVFVKVSILLLGYQYAHLIIVIHRVPIEVHRCQQRLFFVQIAFRMKIFTESPSDRTPVKELFLFPLEFSFPIYYVDTDGSLGVRKESSSILVEIDIWTDEHEFRLSILDYAPKVMNNAMSDKEFCHSVMSSIKMLGWSRCWAAGSNRRRARCQGVGQWVAASYSSNDFFLTAKIDLVGAAQQIPSFVLVDFAQCYNGTEADIRAGWDQSISNDGTRSKLRCDFTGLHLSGLQLHGHYPLFPTMMGAPNEQEITARFIAAYRRLWVVHAYCEGCYRCVSYRDRASSFLTLPSRAFGIDLGAYSLRYCHSTLLSSMRLDISAQSL